MQRPILLPSIMSNRQRLVLFVMMLLIEITFGIASQQFRPPHGPAAPMLVQNSSTSSWSKAGSLESHTSPPDPWTYIGPEGRYKFSNYRDPSVKLSWMATFLVTCLGDVFDATANQGFKPYEPYPDGTYNCNLDYIFPSGSSGIFTLEMTKVEAPNWYMTFSDIVEDLEALWYATLWFEERTAGVPEMDFEVTRIEPQSPGGKGPSFLASRGNFRFALTLRGMANGTYA